MKQSNAIKTNTRGEFAFTVVSPNPAESYVEIETYQDAGLTSTKLGKATCDLVNGLADLKGGYISMLADRICNDLEALQAEATAFCEVACDFHGGKAANPFVMRLRSALGSDTMQRITGNKWTVKVINGQWELTTAKEQAAPTVKKISMERVEGQFLEGLKRVRKPQRAVELVKVMDAAGLTVADLMAALKEARKAK